MFYGMAERGEGDGEVEEEGWFTVLSFRENAQRRFAEGIARLGYSYLCVVLERLYRNWNR